LQKQTSKFEKQAKIGNLTKKQARHDMLWHENSIKPKIIKKIK